jgi:hypothetical protein
MYPALRPVGAAREFLVPPPRFLAAAPGVDDAVGEPPELLDQREPQHDRNGPDFADRQMRGALVGTREVDDRLEINSSGGVDDQFPCEHVNAWIASKGAVSEFGKLEIVAARKVLTNLANLVLNDMMVVAQPVFRRNRLGVGAGGGG